MEKVNKKQSILITFMQAYLLSLGGINELMGIVLKKSDGIMIMNLAPIAALMLLHFFISNKNEELNLDKKALLFVYYIGSIIVVYKYAFRHTTYSYEDALVYCFIPIYLSFYKVNVEKLLKFMMLISVLVVPVSAEFFSKGGYYYETIGMSSTYNILPFVVAAILHFWYYRKNAGFWCYVGYVVNIYYLFMVIFYGNRGPMISLMVLVILVFLHKFTDENVSQKNRTRTVVITIIVGALAIYLVNYLEEILYSLNNWFNSMGIEIAALTKSVQKLGSGDLSNGRTRVFDFTFAGIKEHYLIGNGIATMYYNSFYRIAYPHNLFLQMWYDLGIIVSIPLVFIVLKSIRKTLFEAPIKKDYATIMILLFTLAIPRLCVSAEFWTNIPFWFLIMYTISPNLYGDKNIKN